MLIKPKHDYFQDTINKKNNTITKFYSNQFTFADSILRANARCRTKHTKARFMFFLFLGDVGRNYL